MENQKADMDISDMIPKEKQPKKTRDDLLETTKIMDSEKKKKEKVRCPHCGKMFKDLSRHKCKKKPKEVVIESCEGCKHHTPKRKEKCRFGHTFGSAHCKKMRKVR